MAESEEHKRLKECACAVFNGVQEVSVNGRVDVKARKLCVEIERSSNLDRLKLAVDKLQSSNCNGGFLVAPTRSETKVRQLLADSENVIFLPLEKFRKICGVGRVKLP
jgi:hypothetical protein